MQQLLDMNNDEIMESPTEFGNSTRNDVGVPAEGTLPHVHAAVWEPAPSPPKASLSCALSPLHNGVFFFLFLPK